MNEKQSIGELVPVVARQVSDESIQTVNARDLHSWLGSGKKFADWIRGRVAKYSFVENQDFVCSPNLGSKGRGGHNAIDYHISLEMAKELAMVENNEKGREARRYFIDCERRAKELPMMSTEQMIAALATSQHESKLLLQETARKTKAIEVEQQRQADQLSKIGEVIYEVFPKEGQMTALRFIQMKRPDLKTDGYQVSKHGKALSKLCRTKGITPGRIKTVGTRWPYVNTYPIEILEEHFSVIPKGFDWDEDCAIGLE